MHSSACLACVGRISYRLTVHISRPLPQNLTVFHLEVLMPVASCLLVNVDLCFKHGLYAVAAVHPPACRA